MSRFRSSSIQYWLWATLAARYGTALELRRGGCARMYEVNRHDFDAKPSYEVSGGIQVRVSLANDMYQYLVEILVQAGYEAECPDRLAEGSPTFIKRIADAKFTYELHISVRFCPTVFDRPNEIVNVSVSLYRRPHKK